jgi:hypothetical protein
VSQKTDKAKTSSSIEITVLGQKLSFKPLERAGDMDAELIREVAELVQTRIDEAQRRHTRAQSPHQITLLALMDLGAEYVKAKRRTVEYKRHVDLKSSELLERIQTELS